MKPQYNWNIVESDVKHHKPTYVGTDTYLFEGKQTD